MWTDYLLLSDPEIKEDPATLKFRVARVFGDRIDQSDNKTVRYLYSYDPEIGPDNDRWIRVRCFDGVKQILDLGKEIGKYSEFNNGDLVQISAYISVKNKTVTRENARLSDGVFVLGRHIRDCLAEDPWTDRVKTFHCSIEKKGRKAFPYRGGYITMIGEITDAVKLKELMRQGIGYNKAYGSGLITMKRLEDET